MRASRARRQPAQARSRATVEAIVEAAAQVFEARGFERTTTNHIAERAGVSIGSLYQYFADKEEIFGSVAQAHLAEVGLALAPLIGRLDEQPPPPFEEVCTAFLRCMLEVHRRHPQLNRLMLEGARVGPEFETMVMAYEGVVAEAVAPYLRRLGVHGPDPILTARLLVQTVNALCHRWIAIGDSAEDDLFVESVLALLGDRS